MAHIMKVKHYGESFEGKHKFDEFVEIEKGNKSVYVFLDEVKVETPRTSRKMKW